MIGIYGKSKVARKKIVLAVNVSVTFPVIMALSNFNKRTIGVHLLTKYEFIRG